MHRQHASSSGMITVSALVHINDCFTLTHSPLWLLLHCTHCHTTARQLRAHLNWAIDNLKQLQSGQASTGSCSTHAVIAQYTQQQCSIRANMDQHNQQKDLVVSEKRQLQVFYRYTTTALMYTEYCTLLFTTKIRLFVALYPQVSHVHGATELCTAE